MAFKLTPEKWAGIAYLAPAAAVGGIWAVLLLVSNPSKSGPIDIGFLRYALFEERERWFFWWLATLPVPCLLLSVSYFSAMARARVGAITRGTVGAGLAVITGFPVGWTCGVFVRELLLFS